MSVKKLFPLQDPNYQPEHIPIDGMVPPIIARWGKASQLRWFKRFSKITPKGFTLSHRNDFSIFWCDSEHHIGPCCGSCIGEFEDGFGVMMDGWCCCKDPRMQKRYGTE